MAVDGYTDNSVIILCTCIIKCLKGLFEFHDPHSRHTVPLAHFTGKDAQAQLSASPGETEVGNQADPAFVELNFGWGVHT